MTRRDRAGTPAAPAPNNACVVPPVPAEDAAQRHRLAGRELAEKRARSPPQPPERPQSAPPIDHPPHRPARPNWDSLATRPRAARLPWDLRDRRGLRRLPQSAAELAQSAPALPPES